MRERVYEIRLAETDDPVVAQKQYEFIRRVHDVVFEDTGVATMASFRFTEIVDTNFDAIVKRSR
jgi:hypothetical protein